MKYQVQTVQIPNEFTVDTLINSACDIVQLGVNQYDGGGGSSSSSSAVSAASVEQLRTWAKMSSSHVVLASQNYLEFFGNYGPAVEGNSNPMTSTELGRPLDTSGPFGAAPAFNQGGGWQGTLTTLDEDACVMIRDATGKPTFALDVEYGSVFMADCGMLTELAGMTEGSAITSINDKMFGNLYSFLIAMVCYGPPETCEFETDPFTICVEE